MRYELLKNGVVVNTLIADAKFMSDHFEAGSYRQAVEVEMTKPPEPRRITPGALRDRMGSQKFAILSSQDVEVKALLLDIADRHYIDLDHPELMPGLQLLVSKGFAIDPEAIINAEIQEVEKL